MCVIMIATPTATPSLEMLKAGEKTNRDGGGVAWVGKDGLVYWRKNIDAQRIHKILKKVGRPAVVHFRIGTYGKADKSLCHPFAINEAATTTTKGSAEKVLFHNGHWTNFLENYDMAEHTFGVPSGQSSDTRFIAYLLHKFPEKTETILDWINDKFVILSKDGAKVFGKNWVEVDGIQCSNANFNTKSYPITPTTADYDYWHYHRRGNFHQQDYNVAWDKEAEGGKGGWVPQDYTRRYWSYKDGRYIWPGDKDFPTPPKPKGKKEIKEKQNGHGKDCICDVCITVTNRADAVKKFMVRHFDAPKTHPAECLCWKCRIHDLVCHCGRCMADKARQSLNDTPTNKDAQKAAAANDADTPRELELGRP